ncbi:MAG: DUF58 domain-containing protein [Planctomycetota bacterium]
MAIDRQLRSFLDPQALSRLASVPFLARMPMQGNVSGRHSSSHRGASVEFAEYRKYVPGDDIRRLDWRAYGRTDRHYVKEFEADTNLRCCFIVDTSGSMKYGSQSFTKIEYARRIAATLSYLAVQQGDAVGLSCVADGIVESIPARRNPAHLVHVFDLLERIEPRGPSEFTSVLHQLAETIAQRALVVIISDFFVDPDALRGCFEHFRFRKHDLAAFQLLDLQETDFDFRRPMRFIDLEGGPAVFAEPHEIAQRYLQALARHTSALDQAMVETHVDFYRARLDDDYEQVLMRFLVGRTRAGGVR